MSDWQDIGLVQPENDLPCEYTIEVTCRGWFRPHEEEPRFAADERVPPKAKLAKWKRWEDGESWPEGQRLVREHREKLAETQGKNE